MSYLSGDGITPTLEPGAHVEWHDGTAGDIGTGILVKPAGDFGGPRWLVTTKWGESYVQISAMYAPGGVQLERTAQEIASVLRAVQYRRGERFHEWDYAVAVAAHQLKQATS